MSRARCIEGRLARHALLAAFTLPLLVAAPARALEPPTGAAPPAPSAPSPPSPPSPRRVVPDYDGRGRAPVRASELILWLPRLILSPAYLVTEYVLRRPLSVIVPAAERADVPRTLYDLFTFGPDHDAGLFPVAFVEFNFNPSVGVYAYWDDAGFRGNHLHTHVEAWPDEWLAGSLAELVQIDARSNLQLRVAGVRRPDKVFYGLGPESLQGDQSRYGIQLVEGKAGYESHFWRSSRVQTMVGVRDVGTYDGRYGSDPSLLQHAASGAFAVPYGFGRPYTVFYDQLVASIDSRLANNHPAPGASLELEGEHGGDVRGSPSAGWIRYGATAAGYVDLDGYGRVLGLSLAAQLVDPLGPSPVPFTELVYLGGDRPMPGYYDGRLRDRSAATATATYAWPIGPWLDGDLQFDVGDVFGAHFDGFDGRLLRFSGAFGLALTTSKDSAFQQAPMEFVVGLGSETFAHGAQIDAVRVMFGVPTAF